MIRAKSSVRKGLNSFTGWQQKCCLQQRGPDRTLAPQWRAFLTTRVRDPNEGDWIKLAHLMKHVRGAMDLPLILRADGSGLLKWYIDASHGVHPNMRGHTGGGLTMGTGFPITTSTKQKLNTRSSTETEIVGVDDMMPGVLWTRLFLEAQGYGVNESIVFQDNQSAMLLEKNGKSSSGKRTKHIEMRYFFVTDQIAKGRLKVLWCPTADMTGDFGTCLLYTSPSPRDLSTSRMPSSA